MKLKWDGGREIPFMEVEGAALWETGRVWGVLRGRDLFGGRNGNALFGG